MSKYWMAVASKNHVAIGLAQGFAQVCHGKVNPLKKMSIGDGIIYYSPKINFNKKDICQEFTAIGTVTTREIYQYDMGEGFQPYRINIEYDRKAQAMPIKSLIAELKFIENKKNWGFKFRFGFFEIPEEDFLMIQRLMCKDV